MSMRHNIRIFHNEIRSNEVFSYHGTDCFPVPIPVMLLKPRGPSVIFKAGGS